MLPAMYVLFALRKRTVIKKGPSDPAVPNAAF